MPLMNEIYGIDVSTAQGSIDWETLAANKDISFVIIRAAQGTFQDSRFAYNITECRRVGIPYGLYFASSAKTEAEVSAESKFAIEYGRLYSPTYGMWFDMELDSQKLLGKTAISKMMRLWLESVSAAGLRCGVYTNKDWLDNRIDKSIIEDFGLWYAAYPSTARGALLGAPKNNREKLSYPTAEIWQWSSTGRIEGIIGNVDLNVCYVEFADKMSKDLGYITFEEAKEILSNLGYRGIVI